MSKIKGVVFDLYGTLYDVYSVAQACDACFPGRGAEVSQLWRLKQLEYAWLRSLMNQYRPFEDITEDALVYVCHRLALPLSDAQRAMLCDAYLKLQPFPETASTLGALQALGVPLAILSNGSSRSIASVVQHSGLEQHFAHLISIEQVRLYKPHTRAYELGEQYLGAARHELLFVSSNPWDASGARHFGYQVAWVNRTGTAFDELGVRPDREIASLAGLLDAVRA
ncbi:MULTISPECIES: haloacid dehalogenase type II [unclassified Cupriavidus]|uniref:haloacid dehalogenase type II n=1 Tax=Cupriavidus sp. H19C3 TaxID=3241603 RepID=UPI0011D46967|nr:MAG: haloacid dehalogenase type II [Cupriavidus sp.]